MKTLKAFIKEENLPEAKSLTEANSPAEFVDFAVKNKLIKDDSHKKELLLKIIKGNQIGDFLDFISINTEKARDILDKNKISRDKSIEYIIQLLATPAGIKRLTNFKGY